MTSRPPHRPSGRDAMLDAAEAHLRAGGTLSLESAARAAGVTKAGLMYHFNTKEQLMSAVLDRLISRYEHELSEQLLRTAGNSDLSDATAAERIAAYVTWACTSTFDITDLVMFTDPRLRGILTQRWVERLEPWLHVPDELDADHRARLLAARLMADGAWFSGASGFLPLTTQQRRGAATV